MIPTDNSNIKDSVSAALGADYEYVKRRTLEGTRDDGDDDPRDEEPAAIAVLYDADVGDSMFNWPESSDAWIQVPCGMVLDREAMR